MFSAALSVDKTTSAIVEAASRDLSDPDLAGVVLATNARKRLLIGKVRVESGIAASGGVTTHLSPQRKSAPHAPTARRMDDVVQAGLLARGSSPFSGLPGLCSAKPSGIERRIHRRQLRGQLRTCLWNGAAHRIPSWLTNAISAPELHELNKPVRRVSTNRSDFSMGVARAQRENKRNRKIAAACK